MDISRCTCEVWKALAVFCTVSSFKECHLKRDPNDMASSPCERARISLPAGSQILRRGFGQTTSFPRNVQLLRHSSVRYKKNADIKSNSKLCPMRISCQTCDLRPLRWGRAHGLFFDVSSLFVQPETGERCASGAPRSPPSCGSHLPGGAGDDRSQRRSHIPHLPV